MNRQQTRARLIQLEIEADRLPEDEQWYLRGANLYEADLQKADLQKADLRGANLYEADLRGADLYEADLQKADLRGANLRGADLQKADLRGADLQKADLRGANLPVFHKWSITWSTNGIVQIGCEIKTVVEWDAWFAGDEEYSTSRNTEDFERIEAGYQHAKRMVEIWHKYNSETETKE